MSAKLSTFKHKVQDWIRLEDREWSYTVPNLPGPNKLDTARLIKKVSLVMTGGKHEINFTLLKAQDNRAICGEPLNKFLVVPLAKLRAPPRSSVPNKSIQFNSGPELN
ncbi:hypothetical protein QBC36DRAFT_316449 [Triangularia setosa]|uniref:Uncharacterized protein n=1 Tax=Triangularia setosa TaxID=2587417 RepID=A0AAN6VVS7_9PEZI|nr:hypothetical protein QBC36DRAFT_316449 [Podospora setosa]